MAQRSDKRDAARKEYIARRKKSSEVNLKELAGELGVKYETLRHWKSVDKWETQVKRAKGAQPGNKNAKGNTGGAPNGNRNAEKDGAYSAIFFDQLDQNELDIFNGAPRNGVEALKHEMGILKLREKRILDKIREYENRDEGELIVTSVTDMRSPDEDGNEGAKQSMGMYNKDTPFARVMKLQEALYKVQGRIASVAASLRAAEESERRFAMEEKRLEILRMRVTGEVPDGEEEDLL